MDIKVFIEIPYGSHIKYEIDEESGGLVADRILHGANYFPFNYGFIKESKGKDGDPLDVIVLTSQPLIAGVSIKCQVIGMLEMEDEGGIDTKIIATPLLKVDPIYGSYTKIADIHKHTLAMIKDFFDNYKNIEPNKWVKTGEFKDASSAEKEVKESTLK
jgi:inorganic pyrophosphatase